MKLIIAGGRDYELDGRDMANLTLLHRRETVTEVVSGKCPTGVDACGEYWAELEGIPVKGFPAKWSDLTAPGAVIRTRRDGTKYNANAGPIRNAEMADYADALAVFPGGRGTASMIAEAKKRGLRVFDFSRG